MAKKHDQEAAPTRPLERDATPQRRLGLFAIRRDRVAFFPLPEVGEVEIGRSSGATIHIDDDSLSRRHAILRIPPLPGTTDEGRTLWLEDLGSANGTIVRGARLEPGRGVAIRDGDAFELGAVLVVLQQVPEASASPVATARDQLVERVATSDLSVLILGETGVGKEVLAQRIHRASRRAKQPFVGINCAALTSTLLESELFGHEKGSFTGATAKKLGLVEAAHGGTLFLDEIGEMPVEAQAKLLRVLEAREVQAVGAVQAQTIDVRFIAATHRDPGAAIAEGRLREDLYYRLAGITLTVPPLRERRDEIAGLVRGFADALAERMGHPPAIFSEPALAALRAHDWPGNVRELRNVVERASILAEGGMVDVAQLDLAAQAVTTDDPERASVLAVLASCGGNQTAAAEQLGISRRALVYKMNKWGLTKTLRRRS